MDSFPQNQWNSDRLRSSSFDMCANPPTSELLGDPELPAKEYVNVLLREAASDLRTNNRDLRLILGFIEKDAARLRASFESEKAARASLQDQIQALLREVKRLEARNELLEELLDLPGNETVSTSAIPSNPLSLEVLSRPSCAFFQNPTRGLNSTREGTSRPLAPTPLAESATATSPSNSPSPTDFGDDVRTSESIPLLLQLNKSLGSSD